MHLIDLLNVVFAISGSENSLGRASVSAGHGQEMVTIGVPKRQTHPKQSPLSRALGSAMNQTKQNYHVMIQLYAVFSSYTLRDKRRRKLPI